MNFDNKTSFRLFLFVLIILSTSLINELKSQDFGGEKVDISNYVRRIYNSQPFNGVKLLQTQDGLDYMVSVVELKKDPSKSEGILSRIATIKAKSYASQFINGSNVSTDVIVVSTEERKKDSVITKTTIHEVLKETSTGFVDGIELLTKFDSSDSNFSVYVFYKSLKK